MNYHSKNNYLVHIIWLSSIQLEILYMHPGWRRLGKIGERGLVTKVLLEQCVGVHPGVCSQTASESKCNVQQ